MSVNFPIPADLSDLIAKVQDRSDAYGKRIRVSFTNGYRLSIIQSQYSYGGSEGLFEIAPINLAGSLDGSLFDEDDRGDDVLGWCDIDKVNHYMQKLALL